MSDNKKPAPHEPRSFFAESAFEAVRQIRGTLGPKAVVLEVKKLPKKGLKRYLGKPQIEVIAHVPQAEDPTEAGPGMPTAKTPKGRAPRPATPTSSNFEGQDPAKDGIDSDGPASPILNVYRDLVKGPKSVSNEAPEPAQPKPEFEAASSQTRPSTPVRRPSFLTDHRDLSRSEALLRKIGLQDLAVARVMDRLQGRFEALPPKSAQEEFDACQEILLDMWGQPSFDDLYNDRPLLLMGASGAGKTTVLCKWMSVLALNQNASARVWRLNGITANTAESLDFYAEILNVPVERVAPKRFARKPGEVLFIDLPGIDWKRSEQIAEMEERVRRLVSCRRYLVLNAAYETGILEAQIRAFAPLKPEGIVVTHLDEELRWGKLLNLGLGTNCSLKILSGGQNIPGFFEVAAPERVLSHVFPKNPANSA